MARDRDPACRTAVNGAFRNIRRMVRKREDMPEAI
jgi:hypothetical protein